MHKEKRGNNCKDVSAQAQLDKIYLQKLSTCTGNDNNDNKNK